jgi:PadR family transcriptional regulator, regulatory protein PadR
VSYPPQRNDLMKGTVEMMVLSVLVDADRHGLEIYDEIAQRSEGVLSVAEGSLYPALKRMETQGLIKSEWRASRNNRRARYYTLSDDGRRQLESKQRIWAEFAAAVGKVVSKVPFLRETTEPQVQTEGVSPCAS